MKRKILLLLPLLVLSSCAYNYQVADTETTTTNPTNGTVVVSKQHARSSTYASGDTRSVVGKDHASAGKTATVGATGVESDSTTTNYNELFGVVVNAAVKAGMGK
jgi:hypothetical protein